MYLVLSFLDHLRDSIGDWVQMLFDQFVGNAYGIEIITVRMVIPFEVRLYLLGKISIVLLCQQRKHEKAQNQECNKNYDDTT